MTGQDCPKGPKNGPKIIFWGFDKNLIHSYVLDLLGYESTNDSLTFCKNDMSGKNLVLRVIIQKLVDQSERVIF